MEECPRCKELENVIVDLTRQLKVEKDKVKAAGLIVDNYKAEVTRLSTFRKVPLTG